MSVNEYFLKTFFFILAFFPFLYIPFIFNPSETPKFFVLIALSVCCWVYIVVHFQRIWKKAKKNSFLHLIILFFGWILACDVIGIDPRASLFGTHLRMQGFITYLACLSLFIVLISHQKRQVQLFQFLRFSLSLLCIVTILQSITNIFFPSLTLLTFGRVQFPLGNPHFLGGFIATLAPLHMFTKKTWTSTVRMSLIILASIAATGSKSAFLGLIVGIFLYFFLRSQGRKQWFLGIMACGALSAGFIKAFFPDKFLPQVSSSVWDSRDTIWKNAWESFITSPLIGFGQENTALVLLPVYNILYDSPHNIFLDLLISSGLPGFILFILIFIAAFRYSSHLTRTMLAIWLVVASFNPISLAQLLLLWILLSSAFAHPDSN